ncbi:DNA repair and recombination protein RadB [Candidatus Woesearchaeota archaeon]|nr:DNA repair and recombination protein RadB [Candidatus Woesearchaeota archaeon]
MAAEQKEGENKHTRLRGSYMNANVLSSGSRVFDKLLSGGYEKDTVTTIYGPAGSGKTCLCILATVKAAEAGKKVIYVDTEGGFSIERLKQITPRFMDVLKQVVFYKPTSFSEQVDVFQMLKEVLRENVGLIVIDSIAMLYRLELGQTTDVYELNKELATQIAYLTEIARKKNIPILITNQVYANFEEREKQKFNMVGGDILKYGSKCLIEMNLIELPNNSFIRRATIKKHRSLAADLFVQYKIENEGIIELKE